MKNEDFEKAMTLKQAIDRLKREIEQLEDERITVTVSGVNGAGSYNFASMRVAAGPPYETTEVGHDNVAAARNFVAELIGNRCASLKKAQQEFDAL